MQNPSNPSDPLDPNPAPVTAPGTDAFDPPLHADFEEPDAQTAATQTNNTRKDVAKATAGIGIFHSIRLVVGFIAQPLIANRLGLSWHSDVYSVSTDIVRSLWLVFEKIVNPSVLPLFAHALRDEGEERAWKFASAAICLTLLAMFIITPLAWVGMPFIVDIYSWKAGPEQRGLTVAISRLLLSALFFLGISSLTYVLLNGYKRFAAAALGDACWQLGIMLAAAVAVALKLPMRQALDVIAWGFVIGGVLKLAPQLIALRSKWHLFRPTFDWRDPLVQKMLLLAIPLLLGVVTSESRDIFRNWLADSPRITDMAGAAIEGSRTALRYSRLIGTSLIGIFPYALSIGIFPYLADLARERDRQPFTETLVGALRICFFVFAPLTAILIALRLPLLRAVWESGNFTLRDTLAVSVPFVAFTLGLVWFSFEMIINQAFYSMTRAWTPTLIGLGTTILFIVASYIGVEKLGWGLAAIAGAETLQKGVKCLVMWGFLRPHLGEIPLRKNLVFCLQILLFSLAAALLSGWFIQLIAPATGAGHSKLKMLLAVTGAGLVGVGAFWILASILRIEETRALAGLGNKIRGKLGR